MTFDTYNTVDVIKNFVSCDSYKAAGTDRIHQELIKYRGNKLLNRMYELVRQI
jgi:hypothetical protein